MRLLLDPENSKLYVVCRDEETRSVPEQSFIEMMMSFDHVESLTSCQAWLASRIPGRRCYLKVSWAGEVTPKAIFCPVWVASADPCIGLSTSGIAYAYVRALSAQRPGFVRGRWQKAPATHLWARTSNPRQLQNNACKATWTAVR